MFSNWTEQGCPRWTLDRIRLSTLELDRTSLSTSELGRTRLFTLDTGQNKVVHIGTGQNKAVYFGLWREQGCPLWALDRCIESVKRSSGKGLHIHSEPDYVDGFPMLVPPSVRNLLKKKQHQTMVVTVQAK